MRWSHDIIGIATNGLPGRIAFWTVFGAIVAGPSMLMANAAGFHVAGLVIGLALYVTAFVLLAGTAPFRRLAARPAGGFAFFFTVAARAMMTIAAAFCAVGVLADMMIGAAAMQVFPPQFEGGFLTGSSLVVKSGFLKILALVLTAGALHALLLSVVFAAVYAIARWSGRFEPREGLCRKCGYDLRASPVRCPECGEPAPAKAST